MNVKLRLYGFALAAVLLAALVGWAGHSAWQQLQQLRKNFGGGPSESFHLVDHVETSILNLNETVLRFHLRKDPADQAHFHKETVYKEIGRVAALRPRSGGGGTLRDH
jgi:hypothetical protein